MRPSTLEEQLASLGGAGDCSEVFATLRDFVRRLAEGHPIPRSELAALLQCTPHDVTDRLGRLPFRVELDDAGDVIGAGISLHPTPHRFEVSGRVLFTWCALDALMFPAFLGRVAHVTSACAASGRPIRLTVAPSGITELMPTSAVVSLIPARSGTDIRQTFCTDVNFFFDERAAGPWLRSHPDGVILSAIGAFQLGARLSKRALEGDGGGCCV